jgi:hypothetical protein
MEGECPPILERLSGPVVAHLCIDFHKHKDPAKWPSAEKLFEHEWLKNHWGLNKVSLGHVCRKA